jgi:two-component system, NtrC family, nitrogen regulation sensor histidine kinase NtrY
MPKPAIEPDDIAETVKQAVFLMRVGNPDIEIELDLPPGPLMARFDRRLISQAVTNIVKNAVEAISARAEDEAPPGRIDVRIIESETSVVIEVVDNGIGLPKENRQRLLEPYMTTRDKGTGLGLAIVGRIMDEHGGTIELVDAPAAALGGQGACVRLTLPRGESPSNGFAGSGSAESRSDPATATASSG